MSDPAQRPLAVVTGASAGIGRATAGMLVADGWDVVGTGRDPERCAEAAALISGGAASSARFEIVRGDFDDMHDVARVACEIAARVDRIDVLINNAGGVRDRRYVTPDGHEATFAANHLAPFLLTRELMPLLTRTAAISAPGTVRVIAVSSSAHLACPGINWDDLDGQAVFDPTAAYAQAKLANILFTRELDRRSGVSGTVAQAMHPGRIASNFASYGDRTMRGYFATAKTEPPEQAAKTLFWMATSLEAGLDGGRYFQGLSEVPLGTAAASATGLFPPQVNARWARPP